MRHVSLLLIVPLLVATLAGCTRQPSEKTMAAKTRSYFRSYGRKYKATPFGLSKADQVRVEASREWHKGLVEGDLAVTHKDGSTSRVRCMFLRDDPFGWKIVSWENLH